MIQLFASINSCSTLRDQCSKSIAGVEVLEIIETQLLQPQADGSLVVESRPVLAAPGASKFTTHALFSMTEAVNGKKSCKVHKHSVNKRSFLNIATWWPRETTFA